MVRYIGIPATTSEPAPLAINHGDGTAGSNPYVLDTSGNYAVTAGIGCNWGIKDGPNNTRVAYHGDASADKTITAHFTWNPSYPGELPPKNVIVYQKSSATYKQGTPPEYSNGDGDCSSGLPHETTGVYYLYYTNKVIGKVKTGYKYYVRADPGYAFDETCTPTAHLSDDGVVGPPEHGGAGMVSVGYLASADVVSIDTNSLHAHQFILIGQKFAASLNTGQYPQVDNSQQWVAPSYLVVFQSYHSGQLVRGSGEFQGQTIQFYWNVDGTYHIACTADVTTPSGETLRVTAERNIVVQVPYYYYSSIAGKSTYVKNMKAVGGDDPAPDDNPELVRAGHDVNNNPGMKFFMSVGTPDLYRDEGTGSFELLQLVKLTKQGWYSFSPLPTSLSTGGEFQLDNGEPYNGVFPAEAVEEDPPQPNLPNPAFRQEGEDSPEWGDISAWVKVHVDFEANMYLMYLPPGIDSMWVPLNKHVWNWNVDASRYPGQGWSPSTLGPVLNGTSTRCHEHPLWNQTWGNVGN